MRPIGRARASLYSTYGSKDQLVRAYPQGRSGNWRATVATVLPSRWSTPSERILGLFSLLTEWFGPPGYRGCPFINASAEMPSEKAVGEVRDHHRAWVRTLFTEFGREAGASDPAALSAQLILLHDGAMVGAQLDHRAAAGHAARAAASALLDTATGSLTARVLRAIPARRRQAPRLGW